MGFWKTIIRAGIKQQKIKQRNAQKQRDAFTRETLEKKKLADGIRAQAKERAQGSLKIIHDCESLVNSTVNPEVFFPRYHLMLEHLETLAGLECTGIFDNSPELPSETFLRVEAQFEAATNEFLDRSFEAAKSHADSLKTETGKKNAIKRYFENMEKHIVHMSGESLEYFDKMKAENIK